MSVIQLTGSTSVIFVDTNTASSTVLLPPIGFQSRFITIKDSTGNAKNNPITVSTTGNYLFNGTGYTNQNGENIAAVSTITINQNYASVTVSSAIPNKLNPSTSWILQNTYAFEDRYPIAQLDTLNCSNGNFSTISTINFQALNFQAASNTMCNSQILSANISSLNVTDWLQVDKLLWVIPSTSSIGIGAYPSTGWALDLAFDARIRSTLSVQQALFVGTSNFYAGLGRVGAQCNAPRYTLDVAGTTFVASNLLVGSTFSVNSGRTTIGNSTPGAYLDVYGNVFVRSSMTVASTLYVGQSTLGVGLNSIYMNGPLLLNASLGPETLLISTSGIGTMFQMGSNGQTANLYFTGVGQGPTNAYMSFLSSGQLGVNCNFPQTYLDVGGGALINGNLNVTSSISTLVISSGKAYIGDYVGSTMQIGDSAYINVLSSGSAFISSLSAGYAYVGSLSSAQTAIGIVSAGQGYIGTLSNFAISSANVSVGQGYIGSLSNASFSSLMISAGQSYIDSMSGRSLSNMVQSTGTSFIGILTSLSVNTSTLNSYSGTFNNFLGLSLQMSSISTHSIVGAIGNIRQLLVSSIKVGITTDNDVLDVTGNAVISQTLTTSNLTVKDFTTLTSNVNIYGNVQYIAGISKTFKIDNTYSTLMNGTAGNVAFGIGTNTPRAGLDVQTQVNMSSANIGILSTGSLIINSLTTGTVIGCNDTDVSLRSYGTSELSNEITVGAVDINSRNIFYNFTDFQRDVNANYISSGSAYIGSAYISTLSSANIFVDNISAGNLVQTIGPGFSSLSSVIWSNFSTLSSYIKTGTGLSAVPPFISSFTLSTGSAYIENLEVGNSRNFWLASGYTVGATQISSMSKSYDGYNWTPAITNSPLYNSTFSVAYNGKYWLAGGKGPSPQSSIAKSYDGSNWIPAIRSPFYNTNAVYDITWNGSYWLANASFTDPNTKNISSLAVSYDGLIWSPVKTTPFLRETYRSRWNGTYWLTGGPGNTPASSIAISYDGLNWTSVTKSPFSANCADMCWNGSYWISVGTGGETGQQQISSIAKSYDGLNWTPATQSPFYNGYINQIKWNGTYFVAACQDPQLTGLAAAQSSLAYSYDGLIWNAVLKSPFHGGAAKSINWNGKYWLAGGSNSTRDPKSSIAISYDGSNWTSASNGPLQFSMLTTWAGYNELSTNTSIYGNTVHDSLIVNGNITTAYDIFTVNTITKNVGINTSSPSYTLDVNGTVNANIINANETVNTNIINANIINTNYFSFNVQII